MVWVGYEYLCTSYKCLNNSSIMILPNSIHEGTYDSLPWPTPYKTWSCVSWINFRIIYPLNINWCFNFTSISENIEDISIWMTTYYL